MRFVLVRLLPLAALVYAAVCFAAYLGQRRLLYFPGPPPSRTPADLGLPFEELAVETADGERLHGWLVLPGSIEAALEPRGVVLVCHGNAGNIADRLHLAGAFTRAGLACVLFDPRGYGSSGGSPSEAGFALDADAVLARVNERFPLERVVLWGESLGGGVATALAERNSGRLAGLVIEKSFTSAVDLAAELYPFLPVRLLMRDRFDNASRIARIDMPLLVVHSEGDEIVPFAHGERLFALAREPKEFVTARGGHNDAGVFADGLAFARVRAFLERVLP